MTCCLDEMSSAQVPTIESSVAKKEAKEAKKQAKRDRQAEKKKTLLLDGDGAPPSEAWNANKSNPQDTNTSAPVEVPSTSIFIMPIFVIILPKDVLGGSHASKEHSSKP